MALQRLRRERFGARLRAAPCYFTLARTFGLGLRAVTTLIAAFPTVGSFAPPLAAAPAAARASVPVLLAGRGAGGTVSPGRGLAPAHLRGCSGAVRLNMAPKKRGAPSKEPSEPAAAEEQAAPGAKRTKVGRIQPQGAGMRARELDEAVGSASACAS